MQHSKRINDSDSSVESGKLLKTTSVLAVQMLESRPSLPVTILTVAEEP